MSNFFVFLQSKTFIKFKHFTTMDAVTIKKTKITTRTIVPKSDIPEGYISSEEFYKIFKEKLIAAYENKPFQ